MDYYLCAKATLYGNHRGGPARRIFGYHRGDGTQRKSDNEVGVTESREDFGLACDRTFLDAVLTGDPSRIRSPYADAYKSVASAMACNESMETGLPVKVSY